MKKITLVCAATIAACSLMSVKSSNNITGFDNVAMAAQHQTAYSDENYAVMSFLQFNKQRLNDIQDGSIQLSKNGDTYVLNDGNNQFNITVSSKKVTIETSDQNGQQKKHTYTKSQLRKKFNGKAKALDAKIAEQATQSDSSTTNTTNTTSDQQNGDSQQATQSTNSSDQGNNKGMISENEWYQRLIAAGWDENAKTAEFYNHKAGLDGVQVAPQ